MLCYIGDHAKALRYHQNELALSAAAGNLLDEGVAHRKVGECLCELGQYEEAVEHQKSHLQLARRLGEHRKGAGSQLILKINEMLKFTLWCSTFFF